MRRDGIKIVQPYRLAGIEGIIRGDFDVFEENLALTKNLTHRLPKIVREPVSDENLKLFGWDIRHRPPSGGRFQMCFCPIEVRLYRRGNVGDPPGRFAKVRGVEPSDDSLLADDRL